VGSRATTRAKAKKTTSSTRARSSGKVAKKKTNIAVATTYHHGDLRRALIDAAISILRETGAGALTLRETARRAGVSHAAPKNHFGDLSGLLAAVAAVGFRELAAAIRGAAKGADDALGGFVAAGHAYIQFALRFTGHYRAMFHPDLGSRFEGGELDEASRDAFAALVDVVANAQSAGVLREGPVTELALSAWSIAHGLATLSLDQALIRKGITDDPLTLFEKVSTNLMLGLVPR